MTLDEAYERCVESGESTNVRDTPSQGRENYSPKTRQLSPEELLAIYRSGRRIELIESWVQLDEMGIIVDFPKID